MKKFTDVKNLVASLEGDADKFYNKGNSAAGTRVRAGTGTHHALRRADAARSARAGATAECR